MYADLDGTNEMMGFERYEMPIYCQMLRSVQPHLLTKSSQKYHVQLDISLKISLSAAKTVSPAWYPNHRDNWTEKHFPSAAWHIQLSHTKPSPPSSEYVGGSE